MKIDCFLQLFLSPIEWPTQRFKRESELFGDLIIHFVGLFIVSIHKLQNTHLLMRPFCSFRKQLLVFNFRLSCQICHGRQWRKNLGSPLSVNTNIHCLDSFAIRFGQICVWIGDTTFWSPTRVSGKYLRRYFFFRGV